MSSQPQKLREPADVHIGRKAVEMGLITANQLADVLLQLSQAGTKEPPLLSPTLVSQGFLTQHQIGVLSDLVRGGPPQTVGKYKIVRELGRGGMGVVYEATDPELGRRVALKMLLLDFSLSPAERASDEERFIREARLSANLPKHPHIVGVYEAGVSDDNRFIAMEFIEGVQFSDWRKPKSMRQQIAVLRDVALAADHAHQHGVIHRDLKPANILVDAKNQPHVTDFGLAKRGQNDASLALTASGAVMGTPAYMSPEQAEGRKEVDARSDVWALGIMLYEILTGRLPFEAETALKWIMKTVREPVPLPSSVVRGAARSSIDRTIESICMKALSKNPATRTPTARAFASELTRWIKGEKTTVQAPKAKPVNFWAIGGIAAAAVVAVIVAVAMSSSSSGDPDPDRAREFVAQGQRLLQQGKYSDALIRFGQALAEEPGNRAAVAGKKEAEERMVAAAKERSLPTKEDVERKAREAAAAEEKELADLEAELRPLRETEKFGEAREKITLASKRHDGLAWKDKVAVKLEGLRKTVDELYTTVKREAVDAKQRGDAAGADTRTRRIGRWGWPGLAKDLEEALAQATPPPLAPPAPPESKVIELPPVKGDPTGARNHANAIHAVAFTPDPRLVLTAAFDSSIRLLDLGTREQRSKLSEGMPTASVAASADGRWLAAGFMNGSIKIWDGPTFQLRTVNGVGAQVPGLTFTPDSKLLISACVDGNARMWDPGTGGQKGMLDGHPEGALSLSVASDGRLLAVGAAVSMVKLWELPAGREVRRIDIGGGTGYKTAFLADGKSVVTGGTRAQVVLCDIVTGRTRVLGSHTKEIRGLAASPDGRWVVTCAADGAKLWDATAGELRMTFSDERGFFSAAFSRNGDLLALGSGDWSLRLWDVSGLKSK